MGVDSSLVTTLSTWWTLPETIKMIKHKNLKSQRSFLIWYYQIH
jgi:hypothetical protein